MNDNGINFFELSVNELLALNFLLTIMLANQLNGNQLNILGNFICALGQNMLTIQAIVGALPENAVYTICTNPSYNESPDSPCQNSATLEELAIEIETVKTKLQVLEHLLTTDKR